ncbi:MAG: glycogen/starch/alpha-glucan phosphorylase [Gallionellaceae bacterium]|jgi:starch phosphorylase|nr:glycogen/starch/alpha-glucan phosphorylase [Gallionellaceae bacterium]
MDGDSILADFRRYFSHTLGREDLDLSGYHIYTSLALAVRDRLVERWLNTKAAYHEQDSKQVYYLSLEFLMGRTLGNAMLNLDVETTTAEALHKFGLELEEIAEQEHDAGLGNGGLGRLAACFLDSCATLQLPVVGYGLRYKYGMFRQKIENGYQVEEPDHWLRDGSLWGIVRPEFAVRVKFGGRTEVYADANNRLHMAWRDTDDVIAVPYDVPVPGYRNGTVNTLRLWRAAASEGFDLQDFNAGDYTESVAAKNMAGNITMVLYPNDASENGKELRLRQQYFLASASLQDVLRNWISRHGKDFSQFAEKNLFQLNDTHPTCAVPELMRLLMDEQGMEWDEAWSIVSRTVAYTNHTLLPEALERWPVSMFGRLLPRLMEIIREINARFMRDVSQRWPGDVERQRRMSIIEDGYDPHVRMAYLAVVASMSVNGVAELHSQLLRQHLFHDFNELWPEKFNNKTNGVTPRRWMAWSNPELSALISRTLGNDNWLTDMSLLKQLAPHAEDAKFRAEWHQIKRDNKARLAEMVAHDCGVTFDVDAIFDVQVKRIHEYKRQLLNVLHVIHLYDRIKRGDTADWTPRCVLIGGKAAPGYAMAKSIIKLVGAVAKVINEDPDTEGLLRLAFLPDYRVSAMEVICAGADLSEQISTAGKEASGTGNMKFMMNGALTIGTLDGANIEIREETGAENFFLFGLTAAEADDLRSHYDPNAIIAADEDLSRVMQLLGSGHFNLSEPGIFDSIIYAIRNPHDPWLTAADFRGFVDAQKDVAKAYRDNERWTRMSIINTATSGKFSSDRTIRDYNEDIWHLTPVAPQETA